MGLLFLRDQSQDFVAMVEEITQRVEYLRFGDVQGLGNFDNRFPALMQCHNVADGHAQSVDHRLSAAEGLEANDVWMFGLQ
jgi:hypothetical protein